MKLILFQFWRIAAVGRLIFTGIGFCLLVSTGLASPVTLWQIGEDEDPFAAGYEPTNEFSQESGNSNAGPGLVTRLPGDPLYNAGSNPTRDDHFYEAGTYPAGFNGLASPLVVPEPEPTSAFERALANNDPNNYIHFILDAAQASAQSRLRLTFELVYGGSWSETTGSGENFGRHDISVRFKNAAADTLILQRTGMDRTTRFTIDIPAASVQALAGANTIQITRTGPVPPGGTYFWVQFDFVKMEVDVDGMADGDNDGLPRWWEVDNHLDDGNPADAGVDQDGDGLTALQEYNGGILSSDPLRRDTDGDGVSDAAERSAGSNPKLVDTDGDGASDSEEILTSPTSSPLLFDTDSDGAPDAWEKRVGSDPASGASTPTAFAGAIGLNFVCSDDPAGSVPWLTPAGVVPQLNWNNTIALRSYNRPTGGTVDIASPTGGVISKSNGQAVPGMTVQWSSANNSSSWNNGNADQKIMNGLLRANGGDLASLTIQGIPFASYHVFAYVGGSYDGQQGSIMFNEETATSRLFITTSSPPQKDWVSIPPFTPAIPLPIGNHVRYPNRSGSSLTIHVTNLNGYAVGLHGIQIIDADLDADNSGIPDWYEMQYALQPAGPATAGADPDGDGLTNFQEFQRGSNPRMSDTDGDGLADNEESAANSLSVDSDGDGLGDYDEVNAPLPSDPSLADTDDDGIPDNLEKLHGLDPAADPADTPGFIGWTPVYSASPATWEWKLEPVQIVWDHGEGAAGGNNGYDDTLVGFHVGNVQSGSHRSIDMRIRSVNGVVTYQFDSFDDEAFSASNQPGSDIYLVDEGNPRADLKSAMGFSGYGSADISDKLRFRMIATRGVGNVWSVNFTIFNVTKATTVVSRIISLSTAGAAVDAGTATWQDEGGNPGFPSMEVHKGFKVFITPSALGSLPAFAANADTDNDGMPNPWETLYQLNPASAADATLDADDDGLNNRDEYFAGTNPLLADTDGDGVDDRVERVEGSNPLVADLRPQFAAGATSTGTDFNHNGLPDAWEVTVPGGRSFHSSPIATATVRAMPPRPHGARIRSMRTLASVSRCSGMAMTPLLTWSRSPWKRQRVYRTTNLSTWNFLSVPALASGSESIARVSGQFTSAPSAFFAVETKDKDSDGDGVSDWDEVFAGSDPYQRDSMRVGSLTINGAGEVTGSVAGDYASFVAQFKDGLQGAPGSPVSREQAARFLQQASFGPTMAELDRVQSLGYAGWIDDQIVNQAATLQRPAIEAMVTDLRGPRIDLSYNFNEQNVSGGNTASAFARGAVAGPDQLRQRVAFALSQILVASKRDPNLEDKPVAMTDYYDIFLRNAFGNYRDILGEVAMHPAMGRYLSHVGNQKARPEINQFPDENFAREVMQLFTIGLWKLNPDGTRMVDGSGQFIPTYDNSDITEMARVFTGFWFGGLYWGNGGYLDDQLSVPMTMRAEKHDFGAKVMLGGLTIPVRAVSPENGLRDVDDALDYLFNHPNVGPFIGRQLIQFLVTSNPSPEYVGRVAAVFANNGSGKRGDMAAVVRAILLDEEARDVRWSHGSSSFGRLKDPVQRAMTLARAGRLGRFPRLNWWDYGDFYNSSLQSPGNSPSVFNFYRPDYRAPGLLTDNQLAGPAFQITNSYTGISFVNRLWQNTVSGLRLYDLYAFTPDYRDLLEVAGNSPLLVDRANLLFCGGMMSSTTRTTILDMLNQVSAADSLQRVQLTVFLASACPEGAVQR